MNIYRILSKIILLIFVITLFAPIVSSASDDVFVWSYDDTTSIVNANLNQTSSESNLLNLECGGAVLIEQNTGQVLYDHHMHEKLRPASVTKVMTILLIMEALDSRKNYFRYPNSL